MAANFVKLVGTGDKKEHLQKVKLKQLFVRSDVHYGGA